MDGMLPNDFEHGSPGSCSGRMNAPRRISAVRRTQELPSELRPGVRRSDVRDDAGAGVTRTQLNRKVRNTARD